jgi:hypothetical protein
MGPFRIGLHINDEGKFLAEVADEEGAYDLFGDWCADPLASLASLRAELEEWR